MALEGLRDLLEDLRGQTQALWDGQLSTNRMLDDLVARGPALVTAPDGSEEEVRNRLHNIEGLLGGILRDLARSVEGREETEPSELSSETSSALRRYIDRLCDPHRHDATRLHMPTPSRAPTANLDSEWLDFLSAPPPGPDQAIQGPPPLVPLIRRATRRSRLDSVSPPPSIPSPIIRTRSAPLDETIREADEPRVRERDVRRHPWIWPRIRQGVRRPFTPSESGQFYDRPGFETWRPGRAVARVEELRQRSSFDRVHFGHVEPRRIGRQRARARGGCASGSNIDMSTTTSARALPLPFVCPFAPGLARGRGMRSPHVEYT
ncbi:hypothetical protein DFH11DRAFT_1769256 [Phellopilus nigrolimitatus]|nr:hypothetical protein DFH11DRAFT_1769256 [Phellopilus nigrolimitatus]